jgi:hypothetical protein
VLGSIPAILKSLTSAGVVLRSFSDWRGRTRGDTRALVEELKENSRLCWLVLEEDVSLDTIVPKLSTREFDRLNRAGFDFNAVKRERIGADRSLAGSDLASWQGKSSEALLCSIYHKIKDLKTPYPHAVKNHARRWRSRVWNIQKRIMLLLKHIQS